jgi:hypothetical protein
MGLSDKTADITSSGGAAFRTYLSEDFSYNLCTNRPVTVAYLGIMAERRFNLCSINMGMCSESQLSSSRIRNTCSPTAVDNCLEDR